MTPLCSGNVRRTSATDCRASFHTLGDTMDRRGCVSNRSFGSYCQGLSPSQPSGGQCWAARRRSRDGGHRV